MTITADDYFGKYAAHPDATPAKRAAADDLLGRVNALRAEAAADGVRFERNPITGNFVSGSGNGGFRPDDCPVGADGSPHKEGQGVDSFDPKRAFARWCRQHEDRLRAHGLYMEREEWTPTWVHLQTRRTRSGTLVFVPSSAPPIASSLA